MPEKKLILLSLILTILTLCTSATAITLQSIYKLTGIQFQYLNFNCNNQYFNTKFSYLWMSLITSYTAAFLALLSSVISIILFLLYFKQTKLISNDQENQFKDKNSQITKPKYEILYIVSFIGHIAWIVIAGQLLTIFFQESQCSTSVYQPILFFVGTIGAGLDLSNFIVFMILIGLRPEQQQNISAITFANVIKTQDEESQMGKQIGENIKQYLNRNEQQKQEIKKSLIKFQIEVYNSQKHYSSQNEKNQESSYTYEYQIDTAQFNSQKLPEKQVFYSPDNKSSKFNQLLVPQDASFSPTHHLINESINHLSRQSSRILSVADTLEEQLKDRTNNGWQEEIKENSNDVQWTNKKPINGQIQKMLKITFWQNFHQNKQLSPRQTECPIQKYLDRFEQLEIQIPNDNQKKNKEFKKEVEFLAFEKKNGKILKNEQQIKQEFNGNAQLKEKRINLLSKQREQKLLGQQEQRENNKINRYKKFNLLEYVRSKYL